MSKIRKVAINSHKHDGLSYNKLNKIAKQFDVLSKEELKNELRTIKFLLCRYNVESVFKYRITMTLFNVVCERHNVIILK